jgi:hypothetical protein
MQTLAQSMNLTWKVRAAAIRALGRLIDTNSFCRIQNKTALLLVLGQHIQNKLLYVSWCRYRRLLRAAAIYALWPPRHSASIATERNSHLRCCVQTLAQSSFDPDCARRRDPPSAASSTGLVNPHNLPDTGDTLSLVYWSIDLTQWNGRICVDFQLVLCRRWQSSFDMKCALGRLIDTVSTTAVTQPRSPEMTMLLIFDETSSFALVAAALPPPFFPAGEQV